MPAAPPSRPITRAERQRERQGELLLDPYQSLPHSQEAEMGTLCSITLNPREVVALCQERGVTGAWFHIPAHATVYETMVAMWSEGVPLDLVTLYQRLHDQGALETMGGAAMVSTVFTYIPTAANVEFYLGTLEEKHTLREVIRISTDAIKGAQSEPDNVSGVVGVLQERATAISLRGAIVEPTFRDILDTTAQRWHERKDGRSRQIITGFPRLDEASPIRRKHTVVIAGRRKSGKSALAGSIVLRVAGAQRLPTLVFSLEMPSDEWVDRLLSDQGSISQRRIHSGELEQRDWDQAAEAIEQLRGAPITIRDSMKDLTQIVAEMRRWKARNPTGALVVIDYIQLVRVPMERGRNREQEVSLVSKTLYEAGKELDVAVVELCQLNAFGNARESTAIEMDCTAFWQVIEDLDEHGNPVKGREQMRTVHVKFQRHGGMGIRVPFTFVGDWMRFTEGLDDDAQGEFDMPRQDPRRSRRREE